MCRWGLTTLWQWWREVEEKRVLGKRVGMQVLGDWTMHVWHKLLVLLDVVGN